MSLDFFDKVHLQANKHALLRIVLQLGMDSYTASRGILPILCTIFFQNLSHCMALMRLGIARALKTELATHCDRMNITDSGEGKKLVKHFTLSLPI